MKRRWFTAGGVVAVVIGLGAGALLPALVFEVPAFGLLTAFFLVSGVLAILGGEGRSVAGLAWRQLLGLSYVTFALGLIGWQVRWALTHPGDTEILATSAAIALSGFAPLFIGVDLIRGPKHFDLSRLEPGPRRDSAGQER